MPGSDPSPGSEGTVEVPLRYPQLPAKSFMASRRDRPHSASARPFQTRRSTRCGFSPGAAACINSSPENPPQPLLSPRASFAEMEPLLLCPQPDTGGRRGPPAPPPRTPSPLPGLPRPRSPGCREPEAGPGKATPSGPCLQRLAEVNSQNRRNSQSVKDEYKSIFLGLG